MCGRATLTVNEEEVERRYHAVFSHEIHGIPTLIPHFNMAPTQHLPVITDADPDCIRSFRWGLIPRWAEDEKMGSGMINARSETVSEKPAFREAFWQRRCLWPVDGYYEWLQNGSGRRPFRVTLPHGEVFSIAGLWEEWKNNRGETIFSFTALTKAAPSSMAFLHSRIPVIIPREMESQWLDHATDPLSFLEEVPDYPLHELKVYRVSSKVNNVRNNSPDLVKEVPDFEQSSLF